VGGANHNFRFLQVPFSLMLPQAWTLDYQTRKEFEDEKISREVEN
jgi:hypothetical protein